MIPSFDLWREQCKNLVLAKRNDMNIKFHFHAPIEICYVQKGEIEVCINDRNTVLHAGELSLALSYDAHCYRTVTERSEASVMIIPVHLCPEFQSYIKSQRAIVPFIRDTEITAKIMECYEEIQKDRDNHIKTIGYINVILGIIMENTAFEAAECNVDTYLSSRILMYINENYNKEITLSSVAAAVGYNASYLSRYFKTHFKIGLNQYVTIVRLKHFVLLCKDGEKNIADCAYESGFSSLRTFYRVFYNEFKCSPKEFLEGVSKDQ